MLTLLASLIMAPTLSVDSVAADSARSERVKGGKKAPRAQSGSAPEFGVQFHGTWGDYNDASRAAVLETLGDNGVSTVRIDVSWRMLQPSGPGEFDEWGVRQVDAAIGAAMARGLRPLVTLWMAPEWATGSSDERVPPSSPSALSAWKGFAQAMVERYGARVDAWEIWNEPNHGDFMRGASPTTYAQVLRWAHAGIKGADPTATVVFGGTQYVDVSWIKKVLAAGGTTYDVMAVHPYQGVADEAPELPDNGTMYRLGRVPALYALMRKEGHASRPIWFTEFGWRASPTPAGAPHWKRGVSPKRQAAFLTRTLTHVASTMPFVERVYWYTDRADSATPKKAGYGLVFPDGSPTRALKAARSYLSTSR